MTRRNISLYKLSLSIALALCIFAPAVARAQFATFTPTATKLVGTGTGGYTGDSGTSSSSVELNSPTYLAYDSLGDMYISDTLNNCVRKVDTSGNITTVAGLIVTGQGDTCNTATNATPTSTQGLLQPTGIVLAANNDLYLSDTGHNCVRKLPIGSSGTANLVTVAGTCGTTAILSNTPVPNALTLDPSSNLYISLRDTTDGIYQVIRHVNGAAASSTCIMSGATGGLNLLNCTGVTNTVHLVSPAGLALDPFGNLYIADTGNNCIREVVTLTTQATFLGKCTNDASGTSGVTLTNPYGITFGIEGSLYVSSTNPNNVYHYYPNTGQYLIEAGLPSGVAGSYIASQDGSAAPDVPLRGPSGLVSDANANIYVADTLNNIVRQLNNNNQFGSTAVGSNSSAHIITFVINQSVNLSLTTGPDYTAAANNCVGALTAATAGAPPNFCQITVLFKPSKPGQRTSPLVLHDSISAKTVTIGLVGSGVGSFATFTPGVVNSVATGLAKPVSVATDSTGDAYFLEAGATPAAADVKEIPYGGGSTTTQLAAGSGMVTPVVITSDGAGDWYIVDTNANDIQRFSVDGGAPTIFVSGLTSPVAAISDSNGNLYVAQQGTAHNVIEVYAHGGTRVIAGSGADPAANNEPATLASFVSPSGVAFDQFGDLFIADSGGHRVYDIDITGAIHFLAGNGTTTTTSPGVALSTALIGPGSLALDAAGDVYIADAPANRVWVAYAANTLAVNMISIIGTGVAGYSGDGGPSTSAQVSGPLSVANDSFGNVFIADTGNNAIRKITFPAPTINFGSVPLSTTSPAMTATLWNIGTTNMSQTGALVISNPQFAANAASTSCGLSIIPGATCTFGFTFTPTGSGTVTATATHSDTSISSPETINLTGSAHALIAITSSAPVETEVYGSGFSPVLNFTYSGTAPTGTITFSLPGSTLCTVSGTLSTTNTCAAANTGLSVGTYTVTITYSGDGNYSPISTTTTLNVTPAPLTVTTNNASRPYFTPNPVFVCGVSGAVNGDTFLVSCNSTAMLTSPASPPTYPITSTLTPVGSAKLSNYTVTNPGGTLTITPSISTIPNVAVNCSTRIYGAANPVFTSTVTNVLNGDTFTLTYSTTAIPTSPAGVTYPVTVVVSGPAVANYTTITTIGGCGLTVTAAPTTTTLTTSGTPAVIGTPTTFTVTVAAPGSTQTPAGTVTFTNNGVSLGTVTLNSSGVATVTTSSLGVGAHTIVATYAPSTTNFLASTNTLLQTEAPPTGNFTFTVTPSTQLVHGAASTPYQVAVTSTGGFIGPITFACTGFPTDGTCTFATQTVILTSGSTATTVMTVTNTAADAAMRMPSLPGGMDLAPLTAAVALPYELGGFGVLAAGLSRRKRTRKQMRLMLLGVVMLGLFGLAGCGCPNTAFHTFPITVVASPAPGGPATQSVTVYLSVGTQ